MFKIHSEYSPTRRPTKGNRIFIKRGARRQEIPNTSRCYRFTEKPLQWQMSSKKCKNQLLFWHIIKHLLGQLYSEFKEFFPENSVEYFVSYYDYYQPESYVASTDTYIEKDSSINDEIDKLRHSATAALFERKDVIIVASVSCIYGLRRPN